MKQFYTTLLCGLMAGAFIPATAQEQIPNADFEGNWVDCIPYNFYADEETGNAMASPHAAGTQPEGWVISSVSGMVSAEGSLGNTVVGAKVEGYNGSASAVQLTNTPNPFMATQIVPAYINLGTTWSTAMPSFSWTGNSINNSDGGAFGGMEFTKRPKSLEFYYKRSRATAPEGDENPDTYKPGEQSTVVAYLWKGHWTQEEVPVTITMAGDPIKQTMVDRDRCVLGYSMDDCQGGAVTKTDDAELIGKIIATITEDASDWTLFHADFEYLSDATPEYINVILASGDYFGGASVVGNGNMLTVDDVKLIYAAEPETYNGYLNIEMSGTAIATDQPAQIEITPKGNGLCDFLLPNFVLDMGGSPLPLGDIAVNDVTVTEADGVKTYHGVANGMQLLEGAIEADVTVDGTIRDNVVNMTIAVMWTNTGGEPIPINVTFSTNQSGISAIAPDAANSEVKYYNLQGQPVANPENGVFIRVQGNRATKVRL